MEVRSDSSVSVAEKCGDFACGRTRVVLEHRQNGTCRQPTLRYSVLAADKGMPGTQQALPLLA